MPATPEVRVRIGTARVAAELSRVGRRRVELAASEFAREIRRSLRGTRSGRSYHLPIVAQGKRGRTYRASAPGERPAYRTGDLFRSIGWSRARRIGSGWQAKAGSQGLRVPYGRYLEKRRGSGRRPFIAPVARLHRAKLVRILRTGRR